MDRRYKHKIPTASWVIALGAALACLLALHLAGTPSQAVTTGPEDPLPVELIMPAPEALDSLFARFYQLESKTGKPRVCIMQIGDSHTALDQMSGELRRLFQTKFGDAGRGYVLPGRIHQYYYPTHLRVGVEGEWKCANTLFHTYSKPVGLSGFRATGEKPGAKVWVQSKSNGSVSRTCSRIEIRYLARPGNGALLVTIDGVKTHRVKTGGRSTAQKRWQLTLPDAPHKVEMSPAGDGPVELFGVVMERQEPGVIYENLGVGGTEFNLITRLDPQLTAQDLRDRDPSLIVLAFGTNESFYRQIPYDYRAVVDEAIGLLQRGAPKVPILLIGPPDANRVPKPCESWMRKNHLSHGDLRCVRNPLLEVPTDGFEPSRRSCYWSPTPLLRSIRAIQREAAFMHDCAYWEWSALMEGACGMHHWATLPQPLGRSDHIHLTRRGYTYTARSLFDALMKRYEEYKRRRHLD